MSFPQMGLYVDGAWLTRTSAGSVPVENPANGEVLGHLPIAGHVELTAAADAAQRAFTSWSRMLPLERFKIISAATQLLRARAEVIATVLTLEQGKPLGEARREVLLAADVIDFLAEEAKRLADRGVPPRIPNILQQTVARVPVGPVAAFTPWNFPANLPARKLGGALAAGCTIVIKPAEETPGTCIEIVRAFADAGVPPGVINLVAGHPSEISQFLIQHPGIEKVSFTGSVAVGRHLGELCARHLKRYTAELGGHAPVIVCADADPEAAALSSVAAKYRNAGQICTSPIRFLVQRAHYERFREAFVARAKALRLGDGVDPNTEVGPLIHARRVAEMERFVGDALEHGGRLLCGGARVARPGNFFAPTVLENVAVTARAQQQEPFGPIALLDSYESLDEAIQRANSLRFGLAAYAFTHDVRSVHRLSRDLEAGMVGINHFGVSQPEAPFGGIKDSGTGSESGLEGLLAYTNVKLVSVGA